MMYTTVPSISIALILFAGIGLYGDVSKVVPDVTPMLTAIDGAFDISLFALIVPAVVIVLIVKRMPAVAALFVGAVAGGIYALIFQPDILAGVSMPRGEGFLRQAGAVLKVMGEGLTITTGTAEVDELLSSGGMAGMLNTIWLILCAMVFGGAMEGSGMLRRITKALMKLIVGEGSLIATTAGTTLLMNATASDQYLAIVVPGRMYSEAFKEHGLQPKVLSRTLEDSGTVTSVLIPWNTCGAFHAQTLGVATMAYLPFCFFNLISPVMTVVQGMIGYRIARLAGHEKGEQQKSPA